MSQENTYISNSIQMDTGWSELKEDVLETLCMLHRRGKCVTMELLTDRFGMEEKQMELLLEQMAADGVISSPEGPEGLVHLTEHGRKEGERYLIRHQYLTEFLKSVCDVSRESAERNACSMEHCITDEVFDGIRAFMQMGITYDRVMNGTDLNFIYEKGAYWVGITIYCAGQVLPRRLAPENSEFLRDGLAVVDDESYIYLTPGRRLGNKLLWYEGGSGWEPAEWTGKLWQIPSRMFQYRISRQAPLYSARLVIALKEQGKPSAEEEKRMLVLHLLKKARAGGERHAE